MTSMAAALAASLPAPAAARPTQSISAAPKSTQVPQRMEGVVDVEAAREVESVQLNSLVSKGFEQGVEWWDKERRCWSGGSRAR